MTAHVTNCVLDDGRRVQLIVHTETVGDGYEVFQALPTERTVIVDGVEVTDPEERDAVVAAVFEQHNHQAKEKPVINTPPPLDLLGADAMQLGHTINMVADLPRYLHDGYPIHRHVRHAISESFAINASLLAGFIAGRLVDRIANDELGHVGPSPLNDELRWLDDLQRTVQAHVTQYGPERRDQPLATIPAAEWRTRLLGLLDRVTLPAALDTVRLGARLPASYLGVDVFGEWKP